MRVSRRIQSVAVACLLPVALLAGSAHAAAPRLDCVPLTTSMGWEISNCPRPSDRLDVTGAKIVQMGDVKALVLSGALHQDLEADTTRVTTITRFDEYPVSIVFRNLDEELKLHDSPVQFPIEAGTDVSFPVYYWSRLGAPRGFPASLDVRVSDGPTVAHVVASTVIG